jgi:hypothetical protein
VYINVAQICMVSNAKGEVPRRYKTFIILANKEDYVLESVAEVINSINSSNWLPRLNSSCGVWLAYRLPYSSPVREMTFAAAHPIRGLPVQHPTIKNGSYTPTAQALHWLTVLLIFMILPVAWVMMSLPTGPEQTRMLADALWA